jgi:hypothetical protein
MSVLDRLRASRWLTAPHEATWRGACDYCPQPAEIAYAGRVVERKACKRHNRCAFDAHQFDVNMNRAVDTGICKAQQGPDGQWTGGFRD